MKKFVAGVIVGAVIATTGSVFASTEIKGVVAEFNILVNGKKAELATQPIVVDGSSYLPVRAISNALGYEVQYENETRTISLANNGKQYLRESTEEQKPVTNTETVTTSGLKDKYSKDGKLNVDLIKAAVENKEITVNEQDTTTGDTLLIICIKENNFPVYDYLKNNGVNAELPNSKDGKTPLHVATILKSSFYMGELLNEFRVKTKVKDNDEKMPIDYTTKGTDENLSLRGFDQ